MLRFTMIAVLSLGVLARAYQVARNGLHHLLGSLFVLLAIPVLLGSALKKGAAEFLHRFGESK